MSKNETIDKHYALMYLTNSEEISWTNHQYPSQFAQQFQQSVSKRSALSGGEFIKRGRMMYMGENRMKQRLQDYKEWFLAGLGISIILLMFLFSCVLAIAACVMTIFWAICWAIKGSLIRLLSREHLEQRELPDGTPQDVLIFKVFGAAIWEIEINAQGFYHGHAVRYTLFSRRKQREGDWRSRCLCCVMLR